MSSSSHSPSPGSQPRATASLLPVPVGLPILDTSHRWNRVTRGLLRPASFTWRRVSEVRPHRGRYRCFVAFTAASYSIVRTSHAGCVHSSADGRSHISEARVTIMSVLRRRQPGRYPRLRDLEGGGARGRPGGLTTELPGNLGKDQGRSDSGGQD